MYKWQFKVFIAFGSTEVEVSITKDLLLCKLKERTRTCAKKLCVLSKTRFF